VKLRRWREARECWNFRTRAPGGAPRLECATASAGGPEKRRIYTSDSSLRKAEAPASSGQRIGQCRLRWSHAVMHSPWKTCEPQKERVQPCLSWPLRPFTPSPPHFFVWDAGMAAAPRPRPGVTRCSGPSTRVICITASSKSQRQIAQVCGIPLKNKNNENNSTQKTRRRPQYFMTQLLEASSGVSFTCRARWRERPSAGTSL